MKLSYFILILFSFNLYAFKFSPMSVTITPNEGKTNEVVFLENDSSSPIAIQLAVTKRLMDENGKEENPEENQDIELYPNQLIIPPFEKKTVKVNFISKDVISTEKAYRIIAEQLPIDLDKDKKTKKGNVKILLRYVGALYIDSGKTKSQIEVKSFEVKDQGILININNSGNKHQVLGNLKVVFKKEKSNDIVFNSKELKGISGENILANNSRVFIIPKNEKTIKIDKTYQVKLSFDQD